MSATINDGGPAFPSPEQQFTDGVMVVGRQGAYGMSLRDYFAATAPITMAEVVQYYRRYPHLNVDVEREAFLSLMADLRYQYADAMLAAREVKP